MGWVDVEGLLLSARLRKQLADLPVPPEQGKFCRALKIIIIIIIIKKIRKKRKSIETCPKAQRRGGYSEPEVSFRAANFVESPRNRL